MHDRIWAKSWDEQSDGSPPLHVYLPRHLSDVLRAADDVLEASGEQQLKAFGLDPYVWLTRFRRVVRLAAAVHDLGKANDHFQGMILKSIDRKGRPQGLRHEWITWLMLQDEWLGSWLKPALGSDQNLIVDWTVMMWSVTGHHAAYGRASPPKDIPCGAGSELSMYFGHADFQECLRWLAAEFFGNATEFPNLPRTTIDLRTAIERIDANSFESAKQWKLWHHDRCSPGLLAFVAAVKNCLVAADVAGSAIPATFHSNHGEHDWIRRALATAPDPICLDELITERLTINDTVHPLRPFQCEVAERAGDVTLVKAGCGSGKTLAAYHWLRTCHPGRRLYLCYPTTGTATEGFRDYVFDESAKSAKCNAKLFHGKSKIDEKLILGVIDRSDDTDDDDVLARVESLDTWSTPIGVCTVDTVLGVMQNNRRGLYAWPALAGAAFVFDEIHAFDQDLFGALLRFIREMSGIPILLMTASLPESRLKRLRDHVAHRGSTLVEIGGPDELELLPRYHQGPDANDCELTNMVANELHRNDRPGKVLWVCNTVNRAMEAAESCESAGLHPLIYHSRFRYEDRVHQHGRVISTFKDPNKPSLAICTQVAEMSLDLSATLLVTDLAPIPALIQRLGRLNRHARAPDQPTMPYVVVLPTTNNGQMCPLPYTCDELLQSQRWLAELPAKVSQRELVVAWESLAESVQRENLSFGSTWLDDGPRRDVKELRKGSPGITVIWERDLPFLRSLDPSTRKNLGEVLLPMPRPPTNFNWRDWREFHGVKVAPANYVDYEPSRGGKWRLTQ